jgi:outer membrane protein OmpA-like peptidoglycan-associated protein
MVDAQKRSRSAVAVAGTPATEPHGDPMRTGLLLLGSLMLVVAVAGLVVWTGVEPRDPDVTSPTVETIETAMSAEPIKAVAFNPTAVHADVYFDFKSTRLRADAVAVLQQQAALMASQPGTWAVLVQGHADRQGPAAYNRVLAERRGETVRQFLVELGVPETSVKVVTIGQDGGLCDDPGPECQRLNRRVHVEMRRFLSSAVAPVTAPTADIVER